MDATTLATLSLLESRLVRIEHVLDGSFPDKPLEELAVELRLEDVERRLAALVSRVRVYGELLKIQNAYPALFHAPSPSDPPTQLSPDAIKATVLASAASFPSTASSLTSVTDCPIPDPSLSASLISQLERMKGIEITQLAQADEIAELRSRSETVVRKWYEQTALTRSNFISDMESRVERSEVQIRRTERLRSAEKAL